MLQHLADGRVDLMMGRGNMGPVYPWFGQDIRNAIPLAVENYALLHRLWREDVVDWEGQFRTPLTGLHLDARGRSTACRRSSGTARSAAPRSPSRPPTTATASSTTTSSGRRSTSSGWSSSTAGASSTTATGRPTRPSSGSAARSSCARTARTRSASSGRTSTTRRSTAAGMSLEDYMAQTPMTDRQPAAGHRPDARLPRVRRRLPAPAVPRRPRRPAAQDRPRADGDPRRARSCRSCAGSSRRSGRPDVPDGPPLHPRVVGGAEPATPAAAPAAGGDDRMSAAATRSLVVVTRRPEPSRRRPGCWPTGWRPPSSATSARPASSRAVEVIELRDHAQDLTNHLLTGFPSPTLQAAIDAVLAADGAHRRHADLQRLVQRPVQAVLRRPRARRLAGKPVLIARDRRARRATRWRSSTRCARCSPTSNAAVVPTGVYAATEDWGGRGARRTAASSSGSIAPPPSSPPRWRQPVRGAARCVRRPGALRGPPAPLIGEQPRSPSRRLTRETEEGPRHKAPPRCGLATQRDSFNIEAGRVAETLAEHTGTRLASPRWMID